MKFSYRRPSISQPAWTLGGLTHRPQPVITASIIGPLRTVVRAALIDTGADETVFPADIAIQAGIDLTNAPTWIAHGVGGAMLAVQGAEVVLRITDGVEFREWTARVAFASMAIPRGLLGYAGFLQYFDATFRGGAEELELHPNALYPGR